MAPEEGTEGTPGTGGGGGGSTRTPRHTPLANRPAFHIADMLEGTAWARGLEWQDVVAIAEHMSTLEVPKGVEVHAQGMRSSTLYIIITGRVRVAKRDRAGTEQPLAELGPGRSFGEVSLIDGQPASASVYALEDSLLLALTEHTFSRLEGGHPTLALVLYKRMAKALTSKLRNTSGALVEVLHEHDEGEGEEA